MVVATFGPPVRIDGPLPVAPTFGLIPTVQVLNEATRAQVEQAAQNLAGPAPIQAEEESAEAFAERHGGWLTALYDNIRVLLPDDANGDVFRWGNGAQVYPYPTDTGYSWAPCSTGTNAIKNSGLTPPLPIFSSFTAYMPETCTSARIVSPDYFRARAQLAFQAVESGIYEHVLATGGALNASGQPYLCDANLTILGGAAVSPKEGLALLENAIGTTFRRGMIHASPATGIAWSFFGEAIQERGGALQSMGGNDVVIGPGYIGAVPDSEGTPTSTQAWAFATGPVQVRREPDIRIYPDDISQALDRHENVVTYRAERDALVTWDTALHVGVLIDRSLA
jgi:hypothetical protein